MFPSSSRYNRLQGAERDTVLCGQRCICCPMRAFLSDCTDLFLGKFGPMVPHASLEKTGCYLPAGVRPALASKDFASSGYGQLVLRSKGGCILPVRVCTAHFQNLIFSHFGVVVCAATRERVRVQPAAIAVAHCNSAPVHGFSHVLRMVTKAKMFLADAGFVVAGVQHEGVAWVLPMLDEVCHAVSTDSAVSDLENTVAAFCKSACPSPAGTLRSLSGSVIHFSPESLDIVLRKFWNCFRLVVRHLSSPINGTCLGSDAAFSRHPGPFLFYPHPA